MRAEPNQKAVTHRELFERNPPPTERSGLSVGGRTGCWWSCLILHLAKYSAIFWYIFSSSLT